MSGISPTRKMDRSSATRQLLKLSAAYLPTVGLPPPKAAPTPSLLAANPVTDAAVKAAGPGTVFRV